METQRRSYPPFTVLITGPHGENLFAAKPNGDIIRAVQAWYGEEKQYNYNNPNWQPGAGHFTQVVWKGTTKVGCAAVQCGNLGTYVICEYSPPGNVIGKDTPVDLAYARSL